MTCCICGKLYDPIERNKQFFQVTDVEQFEVIPIHNLQKDGKVIALCNTCTKAAGFGKLTFSKYHRFVYNEPLAAKMYEVDQEWDLPKAVDESVTRKPMKRKRKTA